LKKTVHGRHSIPFYPKATDPKSEAFKGGSIKGKGLLTWYFHHVSPFFTIIMANHGDSSTIFHHFSPSLAIMNHD
jgi:hypothetical protein